MNIPMCEACFWILRSGKTNIYFDKEKMKLEQVVVWTCSRQKTDEEIRFDVENNIPNTEVCGHKNKFFPKEYVDSARDIFSNEHLIFMWIKKQNRTDLCSDLGYAINDPMAQKILKEMDME